MARPRFVILDGQALLLLAQEDDHHEEDGEDEHRGDEERQLRLEGLSDLAPT